MITHIRVHTHMHAQAYTQKQCTQMSSFGPCMYFEIAWVIIAYCWHLCAGIVVVPRSWVSEGEARQGQRWWPLIPGQSRRWSKQMTLPNTSKMGRWGTGKELRIASLFYIGSSFSWVVLPGKVCGSFHGSLSQAHSGSRRGIRSNPNMVTFGLVSFFESGKSFYF